jgi:hypothetical protein
MLARSRKPAPADAGVSADGYAGGWQELEGHLARLHLVLRRGVDRFRRRAGPPEASGLDGVVILDREVDEFLEAPPTVWLDGGVQHLPHPGLDSLDVLDALIAEAAWHIDAATAAAERHGRALPLRTVATTFGLSPTEVELCLLVLACELHPGYGRVYAYLHNDVLRTRPSVGLALDLLASGWSERLAVHRALAADAPLLRHRLLIRRHDNRESGFADSLLVEQELVRRLLDPPPTPAAEPASEMPLLAPSTAERAAAVADWIARAAGDGGRPRLVCVTGPDGSGKRALVDWLARRAGARASPLVLDARLGADDQRQRVESWLRDARLSGCWPCCDGSALPDDGGDTPLIETAQLIGARGFAVGFLVSERTVSPSALLDDVEVAGLELPGPSTGLRLEAWRRVLAAEGIVADEAAIRDIAAGAPLTVGHIRRAARAAATAGRVARPGADRVGAAELRAACRTIAVHRLDRLAERVPLAHRWDDLVLPADATAQLHDVGDAVRQREQVLELWDFGRKVCLTPGISALFAGSPGTGKTMAAGVLAADLGMELYRVDLSRVVSKYIGETEKHLDALFAEARRAHAILFFDEAEALFGKRSEVKDAHDRYANIEVAFLLQRMESTEGVTILATNLRGNMDRAFVRRLGFCVEFPAPSEALRLRIWQRVWPEAAALAPDVDLPLMARQFDFSGGHIRNIALRAAYLAANTGGPIGMVHLARAVRREFQKLGHVCVDEDFGELRHLIATEATP